jgi:hypothetical protein
MDALQARPDDPAAAGRLLDVLTSRAATEPDFEAALAQWARRAASGVPGEGMVHNEVSGGVQYGPVLQGRAFSGISFTITIEQEPSGDRPPRVAGTPPGHAYRAIPHGIHAGRGAVPGDTLGRLNLLSTDWWTVGGGLARLPAPSVALRASRTRSVQATCRHNGAPAPFPGRSATRFGAAVRPDTSTAGSFPPCGEATRRQRGRGQISGVCATVRAITA